MYACSTVAKKTQSQSTGEIKQRAKRCCRNLAVLGLIDMLDMSQNTNVDLNVHRTQAGADRRSGAQCSAEPQRDVIPLASRMLVTLPRMMMKFNLHHTTVVIDLMDTL